ncbi:MAG: transcriptional repressor LexA [Thiothrix sp.]|nr:MAG: transcriptional repressor LexA [Thiothrix sp.]
MSKLTRRQQEILQTIRSLFELNGYAPTLDQIGTQAGINTRSTVHQHVQSLISLGYLDEASEGKRAYSIPADWTTVPESIHSSLQLLGKIAAGKPIEALDKNEISPNELFLGPNRYALKVQGESMRDIGVMDGDYVVIQHAETASNNDIVVAYVDGDGATLKRIFYLADGRIELHPENSNMQPIVYPADRVQVQGKMVGLFRSY